MRRLTERINGVIVYTQGKYANTTAGEMTSSDVRNVLEKLCEYEDKEHMTNADRIRNMTDEELAEWIHNISHDNEAGEPNVCIYDLDKEEEIVLYDSYGDLLEWLQAEVKEGADNDR